MADIGKTNSLTVLRESAQGLYLDGGSHEEILLPKRYVTVQHAVGEPIDVFIYRDSEDRPVATTETPHGQAGDFVALTVIDVSPHAGAFLDWGLSKDLLLPFREQHHPVYVGDRVVVHIHLDRRSDRIVASSKLAPFLSGQPAPIKKRDKISALVIDRTPVGYRLVIEGKHLGFVLHCDLDRDRPLNIGETYDAYVKITPRTKTVDIAFTTDNCGNSLPLTKVILQTLEANNGMLRIGDRSSPDEIKALFGVSKKAFKQALGTLYRQRKITIEPKGIHLPNKSIQ